MLKKCRKCGVDFLPSKERLKKWDYICGPCRREEWNTWAKKRIAAGLSPRGKTTPDQRREYCQRPDVKKRNAENNRRYRNDPEKRFKHLARWAFRSAVASGRIKKMPCAKCGNDQAEGHHDDYTQPFVVVWLCRSCHRKLHAAAKGES